MNTSGIYEIPEAHKDELKELEVLIQKHLDDLLSYEELKAHRIPFGIYEQRTRNTFMIRIRCPAGIILPHQLKTVARLAQQFGSDILHITTRQEVQLHDVNQKDISTILNRLLEVGLVARGGGGNTVRNIIASWNSGIAKGEAFDVTPYAISLTNRLLAEPDSWNLPRKFKVAFANSDSDNILTPFQDVGFIARNKNGKKGFKVYVAGGMGLKSRIGDPLYDFVPEDQVYPIIAAIKKLFYIYGNRRNKHAARLRFLRENWGERKFLERYEEELENAINREVKPLEISVWDGLQPTIRIEPLNTESDAFDLWKKRYVYPQKQDQLFHILLPIHLGSLECQHAILLADFANNFGTDTVRFTIEQNLSFRNIPEHYLGNVYEIVKSISPLVDKPSFLGKNIACTGANTCTLGICLSQGALSAIHNKLLNSKVDLDELVDIRMKLSGCPDCCGQHISADLGFFGKVSRKSQTIYPVYNIVGGASVTGDKPSLAKKLGQINAHDLPSLVVDIVSHYVKRKKDYKTFSDYLDLEGRKKIESLCAKYKEIPSLQENRNYYIDWGSKEEFSLVAKGIGECSAGLFDLIDYDLKVIKDLQEELKRGKNPFDLSKKLYKILLSALRMLLITRGVEARNDHEIFNQFISHFIEGGLVDSKFKMLLLQVCNNKNTDLTEFKNQIYELSDAVEKLYNTMDDFLQFPEEQIPESKPGHPLESSQINRKKDNINIFKDLRGVKCPLNFVKTKLELSKLSSGQFLKIYLDDGDPIKNVPRSVQSEGHKILEQYQEEKYWVVVVEKK